MTAPRFFRGEWLERADAGIDAAGSIFNERLQRRPAVVARCRGAADVAAALAHARAAGLEVAVRSTGLSLAGYSSGEGMVIDLSLMRGVRVDPAERTAWIEGGTSGGDLQTEATRFGLAGVTGMLAGTGVGLMLGGGVGNLARRVGYASDNILAFQLVTAAGEVLDVSPEENPDLFWAVRGTTGNFGVVTALKVRLHEVPPQVLAGGFAYRDDKVKPAIAALEDAVEWASDDLILVGVVNSEDFEIWICHTGPEEVAEAEVERLMAAVPPDVDGRARGTFLEISHLYDEAYPPQRVVHDQESVSRLDDGLLDMLIAAAAEPLPAGSTAKRHIELPPRSRGLVRAPEHPSALRAGEIPACWGISPGVWWADAAEDDAHVAWLRGLMADIRATDDTLGLLEPTYLGEALPAERVEAIFPDGRYERLRRIKAEWDPENVFHTNLNIPPA